MDVEAIDNSKENIQPLKQGRKAAQLAFALHAQSDQEAQQQLLRERDKHELLIRLYDGPDPIQPRYDYVQWLEQYYPKHGRESNLTPLLEDTISNFKDDPKYKQDQRFVELVVKYISSQQNALELYQLVYGLGIGTMCSIFYKAWAEELDSSHDLKRADQIYQLGIAARAQPLEMLQHAHLAFQLSVGRRMLQQGDWNEREEPSTSSDDGPKRNTLGKLKKSAALNSYRPSKSEPGTVPLTSCNRPMKNAPVQIYQDDEESDALGVGLQKVHLENFPKSRETHRENTVNPGPWNKSYNRKVSSYTPSTPYSASKVQVYMDEEPELKTATPLPSTANALKPRKLDEVTSCPMALFEPPDPSMMPMYCKQKVYAGGREFQLEEIRAAIYNKWYEAGFKGVPHAKKVDVAEPKVKAKSLKFEDDDQPEDEDQESRPENFSVFLDLRKTNPKFAPIRDTSSPSEREADNESVPDEKGFKTPFPVEESRDQPKKNPFPVFCDDEETGSSDKCKSSFPVFCDDDEPTSSKKLICVFSDDTEGTERPPDSTKVKREPFPVFCDDDEESSKKSDAEEVGRQTNSIKVQSKPFPVFCDNDGEVTSKKPFPVFCDDAEDEKRPTTLTKVKGKSFPVFCDDAEDEERPTNSTKVKSKSFPVFCDDDAETTVKKSFPVFSDDAEDMVRPTKVKAKAFPVFCDDDAKPTAEKSFPVFHDDVGIKKTLDSSKVKSKTVPVFCDDAKDKSSKKSFPVFIDDGEQPGTSKLKSKAVPKESVRASGTKAKTFPVYCDESEKKPSREKESKKTIQVFCDDGEPQRRKDKSGKDLPLHVKKSMFAKDHSRLPDSLL